MSSTNENWKSKTLQAVGIIKEYQKLIADQQTSMNYAPGYHDNVVYTERRVLLDICTSKFLDRIYELLDLPKN